MNSIVISQSCIVKYLEDNINCPECEVTQLLLKPLDNPVHTRNPTPTLTLTLTPALTLTLTAIPTAIATPTPCPPPGHDSPVPPPRLHRLRPDDAGHCVQAGTTLLALLLHSSYPFYPCSFTPPILHLLPLLLHPSYTCSFTPPLLPQVPSLEKDEYTRERDFYAEKGMPCPKVR